MGLNLQHSKFEMTNIFNHRPISAGGLSVCVSVCRWGFGPLPGAGPRPLRSCEGKAPRRAGPLPDPHGAGLCGYLGARSGTSLPSPQHPGRERF